ncbi:hypothetical protein [Pedobacter steynii]
MDEGETFLLWFDALKAGDRKEKTIEHLLSKDWNVENLSYFPLIMYQNGQADRAYNYMLHLTNPETKRREYPEVSYGVVKGFVEGLMGLEADARSGKISTLYRGKSDVVSELKDVPVLKTVVTVKHEGNKKSVLTNTGKKKILWQPKFLNDKGEVVVKTAVWVKAGGSLTVNRI